MKSMSSSNSMIRRNIMLPSLDAQSDLSLIIVEKTSKQIKEIEKRTQEEIDIIQKEANKKIEEEIQKNTRKN